MAMVKVTELQQRLTNQAEALESLERRASPDPRDKERVLQAVSHLSTVQDRNRQDVERFENSLPNGVPTSPENVEEQVTLTGRLDAFDADLNALESTVKLRGAVPEISDDEFSSEIMVCDAVDGTIEELLHLAGMRRKSYVLITNAASFNPASSAIHLGRRQLSLWHINQAVHEFGHMWGEEFDPSAQAKFLTAVKSVYSTSIAKELFADIVATYVFGPAYAFPALKSDFIAGDRSPTKTHPSSDERAYCILQTLQLLGPEGAAEGGTDSFDRTTLPRFRSLILSLSKDWQERRERAGVIGDVRHQALLKKEVGAAFESINERLRKVRYRSLSGAYCVFLALERSSDVLPFSAAASDVLAGAWLWRRKFPDKYSKVERTALQMLLQVQTTAKRRVDE